MVKLEATVSSNRGPHGGQPGGAMDMAKAAVATIASKLLNEDEVKKHLLEDRAEATSDLRKSERGYFADDDMWTGVSTPVSGQSTRCFFAFSPIPPSFFALLFRTCRR